MVGETIPAAEAALLVVVEAVPAVDTASGGGPRELPPPGGVNVYLPRTENIKALDTRGTMKGESFDVRVTIEADQVHDLARTDPDQLEEVKSRAWAAALGIGQALDGHPADLVNVVEAQLNIVTREGGFVGNVWLARVFGIISCRRLAV